jgi:uncharacterized protein (DUF58 family)
MAWQPTSTAPSATGDEREARRRAILDKVREIELLTRRLVTTTLAGQYHAVFKGQGMSFDSVREYQPGDDIRRIDWNVTARTGDVFVKQFVEERELTVLLVVDVSASGAFGTQGRSKRELAAEIAAVLAFSAIKNNDRVGLILFSDRIERFIPPKKGRAHVLRLVLELLDVAPQGRGTRIDEACDYLTRIARKRSVVFFLSDFLAPDYERALGVAGRRHDLVPVVVQDPAERALPDLGLVPLEDAETGQVRWLDTSSAASRAAFAKHAEAASRRRDTTFRKHGMEPIPAEVGGEYLPHLIAYFRRRAARQ